MKNNRYEAWVMTKRRLIAVSPVALLYFIYIFLKDFGKWERVITETGCIAGMHSCDCIWLFLICYVIVKRKVTD